MEVLRHYKIDLAITALVFLAVLIFGTPDMLVPLVILLIMEIAFSFDNAIVNARVLGRMSVKWQKLFLTVGILIAVVGMRFIFPIVIVAITAHIPFGDVASLSINNPILYSEKLEGAHHLIAMFGGVYLLLIFLDFFFSTREIRWLKNIETVLSKLGKIQNLSYILTGIFILSASAIIGGDHQLDILIAGFLSMIIYMGVSSISKVFEVEDGEEINQPMRTGWAAFSLFLYLEVQDSAFSFDGVSAAFAITSNVILIAAGLGIGALFVRSMTIHLVKTGQLANYRYLEHGAHWAIGALAICLLGGIGFFNVPEYIIGLIGVIFIGVAFIHSRQANKRDALQL